MRPWVHGRAFLRRATSGLSIAHVSPERLERAHRLGAEGDPVRIDILDRRIDLLVDEAELDRRRQDETFRPRRQRAVSPALRAYAHFAASADQGAVRIAPDAEEG